MKLELSVFAGGHSLTVSGDFDAEAYLQALAVRAVKRRARTLLRAGMKSVELSTALQAFLANITPADLQAANVEDEVETEALALAEAEIVAELAREGLPPPKSIRDHALAVITTDKTFIDRARQRLTARAAVADEILAIEI